MRNNYLKFFILVLVMVIIIAVAYGYGWYLVRSGNNEAAYLRGDIELQVRRNENASALKKLVADTAAERASVDSYFVGTDQTVEFVEYLESLARSAGVDFKITALGVEQLKDDFKDEIVLRGETVSNWSALMNFLLLLENTPYRLDLADLSLIKDEKSKTDWQANIVIKTFQLKK